MILDNKALFAERKLVIGEMAEAPRGEDLSGDSAVNLPAL